jgi:phage terminase small subunit
VEIFVAEYLVDLNATRAAIAIGYSKKCAHMQGSRLLRNVKVAEEIERKIRKRVGKLDISRDRVLFRRH